MLSDEYEFLNEFSVYKYNTLNIKTGDLNKPDFQYLVSYIIFSRVIFKIGFPYRFRFCFLSPSRSFATLLQNYYVVKFYSIGKDDLISLNQSEFFFTK